MTKLAAASINSFGPMPEAEVVPPEDPIFVLTSSQLQEIISRAIQPLQDEVTKLRATVASQGEEIAALKASMTSTTELIEAKRQENIQEFNGIYISLTRYREQIDKLNDPKKKPGETETARAEKIEKYLASRPDHRATFETLKGHLGIDKNRLNETIKTLMASSPGRYGIVRAQGDKRKRDLVMLPR